MIKQKYKNIDPSEVDSSLKYICPNCSNIHWISLREAKTKNFKIVCECDSIIIPKQIKKIKAIFPKKNIKNKKESAKIVIPPVPKQDIPTDILNQCIETLNNFGYEEDCIKKMLPQAINAVRTGYLKLIIDYLFKNLGEKNNE